jgi:cyclase
MLRPRIIPCLLLHNNGLVKTTKFSEPRYVGDPLNTVRLFNEKQADELIILDIGATVESREPDFKVFADIARESRMPLCIGGGVKSVEHAKKMIGLGIEKVALSSAILSDPHLATAIAKSIGRQSVVAVLDFKREPDGRFGLYSHRGTRAYPHDLPRFVQFLENSGVGEIVLNSIERDGTGLGYDIAAFELVREMVTIPLTLLGGAGGVVDVKDLIARFGVVGAAAGSIFLFKGPRKAVLINYPTDLSMALTRDSINAHGARQA